jgi:hypothetical protein
MGLRYGLACGRYEPPDGAPPEGTVYAVRYTETAALV